MEIQRIDFDRPGDLLTGFHDAYLAAHADDPGRRMSLRKFTGMITRGWFSDPQEAWALVEDGRVVGGYGLATPEADNAHVGVLRALLVRPERARRGLGAALLDHAKERGRAEGRSVLVIQSAAAGSGDHFARKHGFTLLMDEARRVLDLRTFDWDRLDATLAGAMRSLKDYHLERWTGPAAPELLDDMAKLMTGMNDAPAAEGIDDMKWDLERTRGIEEAAAAVGERAHTTLARRTSDGEIAGFSRLLVDEEAHHGWAHQADTAVLRGHRGHRLGLIVKLSNLRWFRELNPGVERIETWNAASNAHMLAINEAMGFELLDEWKEWQVQIVTPALTLPGGGAPPRRAGRRRRPRAPRDPRRG